MPKIKVTRIKLPGLNRSRKAREVSLMSLSKKARVGHNTIYQAEHRQAINKVLAERLAKALGVKLRSLQS